MTGAQCTLFHPNEYLTAERLGRPVRIDAPGHPADGLLGEVAELTRTPFASSELMARVRLERAVVDDYSGEWMFAVTVPLIDCCPL